MFYWILVYNIFVIQSNECYIITTINQEIHLYYLFICIFYLQATYLLLIFGNIKLRSQKVTRFVSYLFLLNYIYDNITILYYLILKKEIIINYYVGN